MKRLIFLLEGRHLFRADWSVLLIRCLMHLLVLSGEWPVFLELRYFFSDQGLNVFSTVIALALVFWINKFGELLRRKMLPNDLVVWLRSI